MRRLLLPILLLAVAVGCAVGAYLADQGGDTAEATGEVASPVTPVLSVRRIPDFVTEDIADRRLTTELTALIETAPPSSCLVVDAGGRPIVADQPAVPLIPASNEKLLVVTAALAELGPRHRYVTTVVAGAQPDGQGVVDGDVWLVGGGDPVLTTRDYAGSSEKQAEAHTALEDLADALQEAGVTQIRGRVLGDESRYDAARAVGAWPSRFIDQNQTGPLSALSVNDGYSDYPTVADPGAVLTRSSSPPQIAAQHLVQLLTRRGIQVTGAAGTGTAPGGAVEVARVRSAPLRELAAQLLTWSDNQTAELLLKELGVARGGAGTTEAGAAAVEDILREQGYDLAGADAVDGSGLAGGNRATCGLLHEVLSTAGPRSPLITGLAIAGETGTLATTFNGTPAEGRLRAKTGTLNESMALSGVVDVPESDDLTFSLVVNEDFISQASLDLRTRIGLAMAAYPQRPPLERVGPRPLAS
ncbi:MAG TPA: D-alanyl-D-alanine carboxypeptidase/D-alanyl-D-alanine-endopeptidase [Acidimicrobiales bacterium]|nr:D-alanyl-D-alanine carboxypeptidase/D-alanyl-D-alanine-endopeptidase [Acidimicrobiales bacterium]